MSKVLLLIIIFAINVVNSFGQIVSEGFEEWYDSLNIEYPINWEVYPEIDSSLLNVQKVEKLNEGQFAIKLKSNVPFFEGNLPTRISRELPVFSNFISIKFTCKCEGEGFCYLDLGQGTIGSNGINIRGIWSIEAGDTTLHQIELDSLLINPPFEVFKTIRLSALPVSTGAGTYGVSIFTIDSLCVIDENLSTKTKTIANKLEIEVFPNPTTSEVRIIKDYKNSYKVIRIEISDEKGILRNILYRDHDVINIKGPSGIYNLAIITTEGVINKKVIKIN